MNEDSRKQPASENSPVSPPTAPATNRKRSGLAPFVAIVGWLVPGFGHLLLGRWGGRWDFSSPLGVSRLRAISCAETFFRRIQAIHLAHWDFSQTPLQVFSTSLRTSSKPPGRMFLARRETTARDLLPQPE